MRKWDYLKDLFTEDQIYNLIVNKIGEVTLSLFRLIHDWNELYKDEVILTPMGPYLNAKSVLFSINNMHSVFLSVMNCFKLISLFF